MLFLLLVVVVVVMVVVVMVMMTFAKFFTCIPEPIPGYCLSYAKMTHYASFV